MRLRRSLRFHLLGSALLLAIPASYGLATGLSHQIWDHGAAIGYLLSSTAGLLIGISIGYRAHVARQLIRRHIARLRRKLELDRQQPRYLLSVRGLGYRWAGESDRLQMATCSLPFVQDSLQYAFYDS
jgi:hypothetical protein